MARIGRRVIVKRNFEDYTYILNGEPGIGKTTLAYEVGRTLYGAEEGFFMMTIGEEPEPNHLNGLWYELCPNWDTVEEIIDELVDNRNTEYKNLKLIAVDSMTELFRLAENHVVKEYNDKQKDINKRVKSIKQAHGGYQAGENIVVDTIVKTMFKLRKAGYGIIFIGHTKQKAKTDIFQDVEYEIITSDLDNKYYSAIKDRVNLVATAYMEREMVDIQEVKDAYNKGKTKERGNIQKERRMITFRDSEYSIDQKSHFEQIVPKVEFGTQNFIDAIMDAIEKQSKKYTDGSTPAPQKTVETPKAEPVVEEEEENIIIDTEDEAPVVDEARNRELKAQITAKLKEDKTKMPKIKEILAKHGEKQMSLKTPTFIYEEIVKAL